MVVLLTLLTLLLVLAVLVLVGVADGGGHDKRGSPKCHPEPSFLFFFFPPCQLLATLYLIVRAFTAASLRAAAPSGTWQPSGTGQGGWSGGWLGGWQAQSPLRAGGTGSDAGDAWCLSDDGLALGGWGGGGGDGGGALSAYPKTALTSAAAAAAAAAASDPAVLVEGYSAASAAAATAAAAAGSAEDGVNRSEVLLCFVGARK